MPLPDRRHLCALALLLLPLLLTAAELPEERRDVLAEIAAELSPELRERWQGLIETHHEALAEATEEGDFYQALNELLAGLGTSHHTIQPPAIGELPQNPARPAGSIGLTARLVDDALLITQVVPGSPAAQAGLAPGFELVRIGKRRLAPIIERLAEHPGPLVQKRLWIAEGLESLLSAPAGQKLRMVAIDGEGNERTYAPIAVEPPGTIVRFGHLPPLRAHVAARDVAEGIGYLHISVWMPQIVMPFNAAMQRFATADGLIIDLRGNPGGLGPLISPVAGKLVDKQLNFGVSKLEEGEILHPVFPQPDPYRGPVVVLVDETSGSTSEIFAAGLQELGRATIVGRQTMGAVVPSVVVELPGGGKLQVAFADFTTEGGAVLEGTGVTPDHAVELSREALLEHGDQILHLAIETLRTAKEPTP